ncbi:MAG: rhodanese-like domain-containing protein [Nocardioidaceae bacterium]
MNPMPSVPTVDVDGVPADLPDDLTVVDVREQDEWDAGHIEGSQHVPLGDLPARIDDVPEDGRLLVVCKVGGRSAQATAYLLQQGRQAINLDGGVLAWSQAGRPLVTDSGIAPSVV